MRITNTYNPRRLTFWINLYPVYGQNPHSIKFVVDVTKCFTSYQGATSLSTITPPNLVIDKSSVSGSFEEHALVPTYTNYWVSNRMSECPILKFLLMDTSNNALTNPSITLLNPDVAAQAKLKVVND